MKRKLFHSILLLFLVSIFTVKVQAQAIHITGTVSKMMKEMTGSMSGKAPLSVPVYVFDNGTEARRQAQLYIAKNATF